MRYLAVVCALFWGLACAEDKVEYGSEWDIIGTTGQWEGSKHVELSFPDDIVSIGHKGYTFHWDDAIHQWIRDDTP